MKKSSLTVCTVHPAISTMTIKGASNTCTDLLYEQFVFTSCINSMQCNIVYILPHGTFILILSNSISFCHNNMSISTSS